MRHIAASSLAAGLCIAVSVAHAQQADTLVGKLSGVSPHVFKKIASVSSRLNRLLTSRTASYLDAAEQQERQMEQKLRQVDPVGANTLFAGSGQGYGGLKERLQADTGWRDVRLSGSYEPHLDTLQGALAFLRQNPQMLAKAGGLGTGTSELQNASAQFQALQAKIQDADQIKAFVRERQQQIGDYLAQHTSIQGLLGKQYSQLNQQVYYYNQQVQQVKAMLNDPKLMAQKALVVLESLPVFQRYMTTHSQLGSLFHLPGNYGSTATLNGLQTKEQVAQIVQAQVSAGGQQGASELQSKLQSAQSQLDGFKEKLDKVLPGGGDATMPNFQPNDQKGKTLLGRLQYGFNLQTTHSSYYYPSLLTMGLSLGYKLGHSNVVGIGVSYELGTGNGIRDIAFTSQGLGLRSFVSIKVKGSLSVTGGFEYNYTTPFVSYQQLRQLQYWTRSGLIGVTKTVSTKSKVLKQTTLSLLWDFLSYQQIPPTQPFIFRIGYTL